MTYKNNGTDFKNEYEINFKKQEAAEMLAEAYKDAREDLRNVREEWQQLGVTNIDMCILDIDTYWHDITIPENDEVIIIKAKHKELKNRCLIITVTDEIMQNRKQEIIKDLEVFQNKR